MNEAESAVFESWKRLIEAYTSGKVVLRIEKDMEAAMAQISRKTIAEQGLAFDVRRQVNKRGRLVDIAINCSSDLLLLQLKLYHDRADWKESLSMTNTVESDLKFACEHEDTYVGIIDTIPSTSRADLPFNLDWKPIRIERQVFDQVYSTMNPRTSPPREALQKVLLMNGREIEKGHSYG